LGCRLDRQSTLEQIQHFAAHHLDLGADQISIYPDDPTSGLVAGLQHPKITVIVCDAAYWANKPAKAQGTHQRRQALNATQSYRRSKLDWVAHLDVDEFLWSPLPPADMLAGLALHVHATAYTPTKSWPGTAPPTSASSPMGPSVP